MTQYKIWIEDSLKKNILHFWFCFRKIITANFTTSMYKTRLCCTWQARPFLFVPWKCELASWITWVWIIDKQITSWSLEAICDNGKFLRITNNFVCYLIVVYWVSQNFFGLGFGDYIIPHTKNVNKLNIVYVNSEKLSWII